MVGKSKHARAAKRNWAKASNVLSQKERGNKENFPPEPPIDSNIQDRRKQAMRMRNGNENDVLRIEIIPPSSKPVRRIQKPIPKEVSGRRVLAISPLNSVIEQISKHSMTCTAGPVTFIGETRKGLEASLSYMCGCGAAFDTGTESSELSLAANEGLIWGCQVSATGYTAAASLLTTLDIAAPSFKTFKRHQDTFQDTILDAAKADMRKWAMREKELAIEANEFVTVLRVVDGIEKEIRHPAIMVINDGGWPKRSYGHSYSANSGVAVIIGARTGKVIYADVKISSCVVCDRYPAGEAPPHECNKNWAGPPTGMESAIIYEGFARSIEDYGLVYSHFVGDGDSSVHSKVKNVYKGIDVIKIECKNHVVRNFTTKLMDIATNRVKGADSKISADERRLVNPKLARFRVALRQAIKYNSENSTDFRDLRHDILNIPMHVFGNHTNCRGYYQCNDKDVDMVATAKKMNFWVPLMRAIERVASLAQSLILNRTSNRAECFMSVASKYVEGKRKNFGQRGLYKIRMAGAVLAYNESTFWATEAFKLIKGKDVSSPLWAQRSQEGVKRRSFKAKYRVRRPLKFPLLAERRGDLDYGSDPQTPDMDDSMLKVEIQSRWSELQVTSEVAADIEMKTRGQTANPEWFRERCGRITASFAPRAYKLQPTTTNKNILDEYFNRKRIVKVVRLAMQYGKDNEHRAIEAYESHKNFEPGTVKPSGLFVSVENGIFAASPDGLIGSDGIVEAKCPYALYTNSDTSAHLHPYSDKWKSSSLERIRPTTPGEKVRYQLKRSHDHYRQIVMQLYVANKSWCDYIIWSESGLHVERIEKSSVTDDLWGKMKTKLAKFWDDDLAPELVNSRFDRGYKEYRSPPLRKKGNIKTHTLPKDVSISVDQNSND